MSTEFEPFPDDVLRQLDSVQPPPVPPGMSEALLVGIHAAVAPIAVPWWLARVPAWVPLATLAVGSAVGAGVTSLVLARPVPEPPPIVAPAKPLPVERADAGLADAGLPAQVEDAGVPQRAVEPRPRKTPIVVALDAGLSELPPEDRLREERVLIDAARAALSRSPEEGLRALDQHRAAFRDGQLAEEREALAVQLLIRLRRVDPARERFAQFEITFPSSPLRSVLAASFGKIDAGTP